MTKELLPKDTNSVDFARLFPPLADESRLLLECRRSDYSASIITRAIEDCDAQVMNLNVTDYAPAEDADVVVVAVRVNRRNTDSLARSLARYGYEVVESTQPSGADNERLRLRAAEVLKYIEL